MSSPAIVQYARVDCISSVITIILLKMYSRFSLEDCSCKKTAFQLSVFLLIRSSSTLHWKFLSLTSQTKSYSTTKGLKINCLRIRAHTVNHLLTSE